MRMIREGRAEGEGEGREGEEGKGKGKGKDFFVWFFEIAGISRQDPFMSVTVSISVSAQDSRQTKMKWLLINPFPYLSCIIFVYDSFYTRRF